MELLLAVAGLLIGFALSYLLWWVLNHVLVPAIAFGSGISTLSDGRGRTVYRVKLKNTGRRDVIDLLCAARVYLPKVNVLRPHAMKNTRIIEIPLRQNHVFVFGAGVTRLLWFDLGGLDTEHLPDAVASGLLAERSGCLESLLALKGDAYVLIQVLAYDSFSGARKYYRSPKYRLGDVHQGYFAGMKIVPDVLPGQLS